MVVYTYITIDGLQSIPRDSNDKDMAAMLDELTIEANEESFVIVLQHGGNDVTRKTIYNRHSPLSCNASLLGPFTVKTLGTLGDLVNSGGRSKPQVHPGHYRY